MIKNKFISYLIFILIGLTIFSGNVMAKKIGTCTYLGLDGSDFLDEEKVTVYSDNKVRYTGAIDSFWKYDLSEAEANRLVNQKRCYQFVGVKDGRGYDNYFYLTDNKGTIPSEYNHIFKFSSSTGEMQDPTASSDSPSTSKECIYKVDRFYLKINDSGNVYILNNSGSWNSVSIPDYFNPYTSVINVYDVGYDNACNPIKIKIAKMNGLNDLINISGECEKNSLYYKDDGTSDEYRVYTVRYQAGPSGYERADFQDGNPTINECSSSGAGTGSGTDTGSSDDCVYDHRTNFNINGEAGTFIISRTATDTSNVVKVQYKGEIATGRIADLYGETASGITVNYYTTSGVLDYKRFSIGYPLYLYLQYAMDGNKCLDLSELPALTARVDSLDSNHIIIDCEACSNNPDDYRNGHPIKDVDGTPRGEDSEGQDVSYTCEGLLGSNAISFLKSVLHVIMIAGPILALVLGTYDLVIATASGEDDAKKKGMQKMKNRLIAAVLLLLVPYIVDIILSIAGRGSNCL